MNYTKKERGRYNEQRQAKCERLGISKRDYNYFRDEGEKLRKVFENNCNGFYAEGQAEEAERPALTRLQARAAKLGLYLFIQGDCRGATVYVDRVAIPEDNYTQAVCIY